MICYPTLCTADDLPSQLSMLDPCNEALHDLTITTPYLGASSRTNIRGCNARKHLKLARNMLLRHPCAIHQSSVYQMGRSIHITFSRNFHIQVRLHPAQTAPPNYRWTQKQRRTVPKFASKEPQLRPRTFRSLSGNRRMTMMCSNHNLYHLSLLCGSM